MDVKNEMLKTLKGKWGFWYAGLYLQWMLKIWGADIWSGPVTCFTTQANFEVASCFPAVYCNWEVVVDKPVTGSFFMETLIMITVLTHTHTRPTYITSHAFSASKHPPRSLRFIRHQLPCTENDWIYHTYTCCLLPESCYPSPRWFLLGGLHWQPHTLPAETHTRYLSLRCNQIKTPLLHFTNLWSRKCCVSFLLQPACMTQILY